MTSQYFHCKGEHGQQKPVRHVSGKTVMTQALLSSRPGNRGMELAAGLAHVDGYTISKALANENELSERIEGLSKTNPKKSEMLKKAERVDRIANPLLLIPIGAVAGILGMTNPIAAFAVLGAGAVSLTLASIWALRMRMKYKPDERGLERAKKQLADAKEAKAELCAKTGLSERMVELLQALPLDEPQKHTVLKQAIFQDVPEDYVIRVAGILGGVAARGEDLKDFIARRLEYLSRDISQARELGDGAEKRAAAGDKEQACGLFIEAAKALERVLDYAGAAEMYKKASDAILSDKKRAAVLSAKAGDCHLKAGDKVAARERYEWAAMIVKPSDPGLCSEYQEKAVALI